MADLGSNEYYITRAIQARERAVMAASPEIAAIHQKMAEEYSQLISAPHRHGPSVILSAARERVERQSI